MKTFESWPAERGPVSSKRDHGSLLVVAGSHNMPGAASLAATGAIRSGIGLLTVASVPSVLEKVGVRIPEALLVHLPDEDGSIAAGSELEDRLWDAAAFGPGLTTKPSVLDFLDRVWKGWKEPCVIDADALNAMSLGIEPPNCKLVLTPHEGELARLLKAEFREIRSDRAGAVAEASKRFGCSVVLKGHNTLVAAPGEDIWANCTGNAGMASAGMGDVLSGVIGTLLAQGYAPYDAARIGVHWHGLAGDLCVGRFGPYGFTASEVADMLPTVLRNEMEAKN